MNLLLYVLAALFTVAALALVLSDYLMPSRYCRYRRWQGGAWYLVTPRPYPYIHVWVREPIGIEHIDRTESYQGRDRHHA